MCHVSSGERGPTKTCKRFVRTSLRRFFPRRGSLCISCADTPAPFAALHLKPFTDRPDRRGRNGLKPRHHRQTWRPDSLTDKSQISSFNASSSIHSIERRFFLLFAFCNGQTGGKSQGQEAELGCWEKRSKKKGPEMFHSPQIPVLRSRLACRLSSLSF